MVARARGGRVSYFTARLAVFLRSSLFHFGFEDELEDPLLSVIRLMLYDFEFSKSKKTGDLPPSTLDIKVAKVIEEIITTREAEYTGDLEVSRTLSLMSLDADSVRVISGSSSKQRKRVIQRRWLP